MKFRTLVARETEFLPHKTDFTTEDKEFWNRYVPANSEIQQKDFFSLFIKKGRG